MKIEITLYQAQLLIALIDWRLRVLRNSSREPALPIKTRDRLRGEATSLESLLSAIHKEAPLV